MWCSQLEFHIYPFSNNHVKADLHKPSTCSLQKRYHLTKGVHAWFCISKTHDVHITESNLKLSHSHKLNRYDGKM